jgi:2-amino-4-hydroxy-6-hydroxymethyldihydropteridine diphosphokinase
MVSVYLALGTNMGNRKAAIEYALQNLSTVITVTKRSSIIETKAQYETDQPNFLNMVIAGETALSPQELLAFTQKTEKQVGRIATKRFGPRLIDIDILYYGSHCINTPELIIPHPRVHERTFVLEPLCEVDPHLLCPVNRKTVSQLLQDLKDVQK